MLKAKLEPHLGFLHSIAEGKPSLVCDFQELYRYLIDDFIIGFCRRFRKDDFATKNEEYSTNRRGRREYLSDSRTRELVKGLNQFFQSIIMIPRIRMGNAQEIETLINEEALLFAKHIRAERETWIPRVPIPD